MKNNRTRFLCASVFVMAVFCGVTETQAQIPILTDPNISFEFGTFEELSGGTHADSYRIIVGKPIAALNLAMMSSGSHLPTSEILLDLSGGTVLNVVNSSTELSFSATFSPPLPAGEYLATRVVFDELFHDTIASASGMFEDGQSFEISAFAGFIPEPTSIMLSMLAFGFVTCSRIRSR